MRQAKPRLDHLQNDILNNFRRLGAAARVLNGWERLRLMHDLFHMDGESKFRFDWKGAAQVGPFCQGLHCPSASIRISIHLSGGRPAWSHELFVHHGVRPQRPAAEDFLGMESSQIVTMHIHSVDQNKAIKDGEAHHYGTR